MKTTSQPQKKRVLKVFIWFVTDKLVKLADFSQLGWKVVQEYESNPLVEDSDDEKKIFKAEARAERKVKAIKKTEIKKYSQ